MMNISYLYDILEHILKICSQYLCVKQTDIVLMWLISFTLVSSVLFLRYHEMYELLNYCIIYKLMST